jgi:hypothetical protein
LKKQAGGGTTPIREDVESTGTRRRDLVGEELAIRDTYGCVASKNGGAGALTPSAGREAASDNISRKHGVGNFQ